MAQKYGEDSRPNSTEFMHKDDVNSSTSIASTIQSQIFSSFCLCSCMQRRRKEKANSLVVSYSSAILGESSLHDTLGFSDVPETSGPLTLNLAEICKSTNNFSNSHIIGRGGFGTVYKGQLRDGRLVAVKRGKKEAHESRVHKEFKSEVTMLSSVEHFNLVRLIGFFEDEEEHILLSEYVSNGNLREHLDVRYGVILDLATRLDIAIDVAHALTYLHTYADQPIIHRDVKSSNILLTDTFRAKVADFGFSRTGPTGEDETHISTKVKGTAGYLDPEYLHTYHITTKSDVYSYGVLLIELISARRPLELLRPRNERITIRWAYDKATEGKISEILDPNMESMVATMTVIDRITELAFHCLAPTKNERPTMQEVGTVLWNIRKDYRSPSKAPSMSS